MINEIWQSFKDNVKRRVTNPFLGTFTIVYIIKNWELFYSLLNFDANFNLELKLRYIRKYFELHNFLENIFLCILFTFITIFLTYIFLASSRLLSNTYDSMIIPWIYKITDKSKIVLKEIHEQVKKQRSEIESNYEREHEARIKIQTERDIYENKYHEAESKHIEFLAEVNNNKASLEALNNQLAAKYSEIENLKNIIKDKDNSIGKFEEEINYLNSEKKDLKNSISKKSIKQLEIENLTNENKILKEKLDLNRKNNEINKQNIEFSASDVYSNYLHLDKHAKNKLLEILDFVRSGTLIEERFVKNDYDYLMFKNDNLFFDYKVEHDYYRIGLTDLGFEVKNLIGSNFY